MSEVSVAVIGASGYTGSELVRILSGHPDVHLKAVTSRSHVGKKFSDLHPHMKDICDIKMIDTNGLKELDLDLLFLALPHGVSQTFVRENITKGLRIIDLSGDFRLGSKEAYEEWYGMEHTCPELLEQAVYGLPEIFREEISKTQLVANPGCYPTSAILGILPLIRYDIKKKQVINIDSKSGVTGAGAKPSPSTHYPSVNDNIRAYKVGDHRHTPEIEEVLGKVGMIGAVQFTPHLMPVSRGILTTITARTKDRIMREQLKNAFEVCFKDEPFIRIRNEAPSVLDVRGSNYCDIYWQYDERTGNVVVISAIDNLVKGAAGAAVQNMNILFKFNECSGLRAAPLSP